MAKSKAKAKASATGEDALEDDDSCEDLGEGAIPSDLEDVCPAIDTAGHASSDESGLSFSDAGTSTGSDSDRDEIARTKKILLRPAAGGLAPATGSDAPATGGDAPAIVYYVQVMSRTAAQVMSRTAICYYCYCYC